MLTLGQKVVVNASGNTLLADALVPGQRYLIVINGAFGGQTGALSSFDGDGWEEEEEATGITAAYRKEWLATGTMLRINFPAGGMNLRAFVHKVTDGR